MDNSRQLALVLYETLAPDGLTITKAPDSLGFRRSNEFVRIVDLSLSGRRLIDVSYFLVASEPQIKTQYRVDFGLFKWLLGTSSENRTHLKKIIREAQRAAIELDGSGGKDDNTAPWGAIPLMGEAFIAGGEFIFELSERLQKAIKNPEATHFLSLKYDFRSLYTKILYDRIQPFMDEGMTPWFMLDELRVWMECDKKQTYNLFKHFKNKVLEVAVSEVNDVTGLNITMLTQTAVGSKKVTGVRFKWTPGQQTDEQKTAFVVLKKTYETLRNDFGLSQSDFEEIIKNRLTYTDQRIQQAMEYTRHQAAGGVIKKRTAGYFMKALREGYLLANLDKQIRANAVSDIGNSDAATNASKEEFAAESHAKGAAVRKAAENEFSDRQKREAALGWEAYNSFPATDQAILAAEFCKLPTSSVIAKRLNVDRSELAKHLNHDLVTISFGGFVARKVHKAAKTAAGDSTFNLFKQEGQ